MLMLHLAFVKASVPNGSCPHPDRPWLIGAEGRPSAGPGHQGQTRSSDGRTTWGTHPIGSGHE